MSAGLEIETDNLRTVRNYAVARHVTSVYIYKLLLVGTMQAVIIDGVQFIDISRFPEIPSVVALKDKI